jgi:hypothetical protein
MNKLDKHVFVVLIITCINCTVFAQRRIQVMQPRLNNRQENLVNRPQNFNNNREQNPGVRKVQVVKENFIGRQLNLTPEQGEKFWPMYRQYQNELFAVRRLKRLNNSDAQANGAEQVRKDLDYQSQIVNINKRYNEEFLKILPPEKVSELLKSEHEFNDELIRKLHEQP